MVWPRRVHEDDPEPASLVLRVEGPSRSKSSTFRASSSKGEPFLRLACGRPHPDSPGATCTAQQKGASGGARSCRGGTACRGMADIKDEDLRGALARLGAAVKRT